MQRLPLLRSSCVLRYGSRRSFCTCDRRFEGNRPSDCQNVSQRWGTGWPCSANGTKLENVADEIDATGGEALVVPTDVSDPDQVESMIRTTREIFGGLDIMVNNAGVGHWKREGVVAGDLDEWTQEIEVNLLGLMYGTHFAAKVMQQEGTGDIVNVGSGSGRITTQPWVSYVASKWGVRGFTESSMSDLREEGIRVTHLIPGAVETPIQAEEEIESTQMLDPEDVADAILYAVSRPDHVCINDLMIIPSGRG